MASPAAVPTPKRVHAEPDELGIVDALAQLSFLIHGVLADTAGSFDLSVVQTRVLGVLRDRTPTMNELGAHLDLDKASISGLVDRAQRRGLVAKTASPTDRRSYEVSMTATGRDLAAHVAARFTERIERIVAELSSEEQALLARLATRLVAGDQ
jgi:MarR family transcriptional regulator, lower aerobic nicotinate degradation pathway regulator